MENQNKKVSLKNDARNLSAMHGLYRTLINNMIIGVSEQFEEARFETQVEEMINCIPSISKGIESLRA